jgi:hypothetical protein
MSNNTTSMALVPIEEKTVLFYEDEIIAVAVEEEGERRVYVPMRPISEYLGLDWSAQRQRIGRDDVLAEAIRPVVVTTTEAGKREALCLPIEMVHGWLFGISVNRVREDLREKIKRYQRECYHVLYEAFRPESLVPERTSEAVIKAMRDNALQQARLWETVLTEQRRLRSAEEILQAHDDLLMDTLHELQNLREEQTRLGARFDSVVKLLPSSTDRISPAQKAAIKELVDDLVAAAQEQGIRLGQGRNDYPAVWGALKQRFDVAKYDELTVAQYDEVIAWMKAWLDRIRA